MDSMSEAMEVRKEYQLREWARIVQACQSSGLSNREFCRQNGISEKTYYYRLRQLRESVIVSKLELWSSWRDNPPGEGNHVFAFSSP